MKKLLKKYNEKRDFKITSEPSGKVSQSKKKKGPIFVVQEHHASHLHYDFRLELDGVLKSWAVPKGPSMHPEDKRLAVMVEDHPLDYATFKGTIPKGQYGAGEVYRWDMGTWEVIGDAHDGLKKGNLKFKLNGKKLKGEFVLVRLPDKGKTKNAWLLIKHHDEEALEGSEARADEIAPVKKTKKLVAKKKIPNKSGKPVKNWPGFIPPQLCLLVDSPPKEGKYVHEIKFDGYRLQPQIKNGEAKIFTRNGHDWSSKFPLIAKSMEDIKVENAIFDGEAVVQDKEGKTDFGLLQAALSDEDDTDIKLFLFDCLFLNGEDLRHLSLRERKDRLKKLIPKKYKIIQYSEDVDQDADSFFELSCKHNLEGIISKDSTAPYSKGRGRSWTKTKCIQRQELVIGGYTTGKGSRSAELGALLLGVYDKNKFRYVGKVGTGFSRQSLKELKQKVRKFEQASSAFDLKSPHGKEIHWLKPKLVAEVSFTEWTNDKSLRHPVFVALREDKSEKEIVIEKEVHLTGKKTKAKSQTDSEDTSVTLSHPDKVLFEKEGLTKADIADYYDRVAKAMLPYTENRPLSLVRCPNGSTKQCFYQKHPTPGQAPQINFEHFKVKEKNKTETYVALDSSNGLKQLVQMNAFEIHVWQCHYETLMNPDQIVMDFDPDPSVPFKEVVKAVLEMKKILDKLKLKSFVKTTGGKGLHIHIPFEPLYSWDQVKTFAKALADEMVARNPDKFLSNMSKEKRKGKIFVDYLRNGFGATAIAPYSLRAKELSTVAMPIEWSELPNLKGGDQFTMKKALLKIKTRTKDPWKDFFKVKQKIKILDGEKAAA